MKVVTTAMLLTLPAFLAILSVLPAQGLLQPVLAVLQVFFSLVLPVSPTVLLAISTFRQPVRLVPSPVSAARILLIPALPANLHTSLSEAAVSVNALTLATFREPLVFPVYLHALHVPLLLLVLAAQLMPHNKLFFQVVSA